MFEFVRDITPVQAIHDDDSWEGQTYSMFRAVHATGSGYITYVRVCIGGRISLLRETFDSDWKSRGDGQTMGAEIRAEDPRLVTIDGALFVVFIGDSPFKNQFKCIWLLKDGDMAATPLYVDGMNAIEKNWAPFEHKNRLMFVYNFEPLILLQCEPTTGKCTVVKGALPFNTSNTFIRGGSNLISIDDGCYVGFAHSRIPIARHTRPGFLHLTHMVRINKSLELENVSEPFHYYKDGEVVKLTIQDPVSLWREGSEIYTTANMRDNFCEVYKFSLQSWNLRVRKMVETVNDAWFELKEEI